MKVDPNLPVAVIARRHPESLKVFEKYRLDLCCGGVHPLAVAAERHGLDLAAIVKDIEQAIPEKS